MRNLFSLSLAIFAVSIGLTKANQLRLKESNDVFRTKLEKKLTNNDQNLVFSPFSLHTALSALYLGSGGGTRSAMKDAMQLDVADEVAADYGILFENLRSVKDVTLSIATKLFVSSQYHLQNEYKSLAMQYYSAEVESINVTNPRDAAVTIHNWMFLKTHHQIMDEVDPSTITKDTVMILVNVVYFKANWLYPFPRSFPARFYISEASDVECNMMVTRNKFGYTENKDLKAKILRLPYKDDKFALIVVLPNEKLGYGKVEKKLRKMGLSVFKDLKVQDGEVRLPQFKVEQKINLRKPLSQMGLERIFNDTADFSHVANAPIKVSKLTQQLFFKVDLNGTEAAAATKAEMVVTLSAKEYQPPQFTFKADHPFLFFLEYSTSAGSHILFQGRVINV